LEEVLARSAKENSFSLSADEISGLADLVMEELGTVTYVNHDGQEEQVVEYKQFEAKMFQSELIQNMTMTDKKLESHQHGINNKLTKELKLQLAGSGLDMRNMSSHANLVDHSFDQLKTTKKKKVRKFFRFQALNVAYIAGWIAINLALMVGGFFAYINSEMTDVMGIGLPIAKAFSFTIYLNAPLLLILMSRNFLTK
jgi:hypothetical protein